MTWKFNHTQWIFVDISNFEVPVAPLFEKNDFRKVKIGPQSVRFSHVFLMFSDDFRSIFGYSQGVLQVFGGVPDVFGGVPDVSGGFPRFLGWFFRILGEFFGIPGPGAGPDSYTLIVTHHESESPKLLCSRTLGHGSMDACMDELIHDSWIHGSYVQ